MKLSQHQSNEFTKMMVLGHPGTGKTGGLTSLVNDYWLGIVDMDNGLDALKYHINRTYPDKLDNVEFRTLRDKKIPGREGPMVEGAAKAFTIAVEMCDRWKYGNIDEGNPWKWGPNRILVIDSLTMLSDAAYDWREQLTLGKGGRYDQRAVYYDAQKALKAFLQTITSEAFRTNVIVLAHIRYEDTDGGLRKGFANTVGSALNSIVGAYFNTIALCEVEQGGKRVIRTASTSQIDLKNPAPFAMGTKYPLETGYADIFKVLRQQPKEVPPPTQPQQFVKPRQLQLKRV
jgi:hypothetical protein